VAVNAEQILQQLRALPLADRLRVVERIVREAADELAAVPAAAANPTSGATRVRKSTTLSRLPWSGFALRISGVPTMNRALVDQEGLAVSRPTEKTIWP
jgi:hypothetical protein